MTNSDHLQSIQASYAHLEESRQLVRLRMQELADVFYAQRSEAIEAIRDRPPGEASRGSRFIALTLSVSDNKGAITAQWIKLHFKQKVRTGTKPVNKSPGQRNYNLGTLKAHAPEELHHAVEQCELALRPLRHRLHLLGAAKRMARGALNVADFKPEVVDQEDAVPY